MSDDVSADESAAEAAVRAYYAAYNGRPELFDTAVAADYVDYGHNPPGHGPQGARDDYEHAVAAVGGVSTYDIDALVAGGDTVAVVWTGHLPDGRTARGLSLHGVRGGKVSWTRHTAIGAPPS
ncbi:nuclear transport factor 2 family protein [Gordonia jinhuaensis]|uniref:SnoaL-like domain-containing protein n=1 Tax=Gordonia jinhuaensis TaxID=1517702 RepID=A0A916T7N7_9ACTN|nr:nuclear transport factor 2 family protein [Gordonia jinhuaensis]GGB32319.1 hypothetical protein GCM10011489_20620 [Gordonia jinhuaensis]